MKLKKHNGIFLGVCKTIAKWLNIDPLLLRIVAIIFFNEIFLTYVIIGFIFSLVLEDAEEEKENTFTFKIKEKRKSKNKKLNNYNNERDLSDLKPIDNEYEEVKIRNGKIIKET